MYTEHVWKSKKWLCYEHYGWIFIMLGPLYPRTLVHYGWKNILWLDFLRIPDEPVGIFCIPTADRLEMELMLLTRWANIALATNFESSELLGARWQRRPIYLRDKNMPPWELLNGLTGNSTGNHRFSHVFFGMFLYMCSLKPIKWLNAPRLQRLVVRIRSLGTQLA